MRNISIVVDVQGKNFKTGVDKKIFTSKSPQANFNPNPKLNPRVSVGVNFWENDKRSEPETKFKRLVSSWTFREKS